MRGAARCAACVRLLLLLLNPQRAPSRYPFGATPAPRHRQSTSIAPKNVLRRGRRSAQVRPPRKVQALRDHRDELGPGARKNPQEEAGGESSAADVPLANEQVQIAVTAYRRIVIRPHREYRPFCEQGANSLGGEGLQDAKQFRRQL